MKVDKPNQIPESNCKTISFPVSTKMLKTTFNVLLWTCYTFISFIAKHWSWKFQADEQCPLWVVLAFLSQEWGFRRLLLDGASEVEEPVFWREPEEADRAGRRQGGSAAYVRWKRVFDGRPIDGATHTCWSWWLKCQWVSRIRSVFESRNQPYAKESESTWYSRGGHIAKVWRS